MVINLLKNIKVMDKMPLITDFFKIDCRSKDGAIYSNIHSGIAYESSLHMRHIWNPMPKNALGYNVLILGTASLWNTLLSKCAPSQEDASTHPLKNFALFS